MKSAWKDLGKNILASYRPLDTTRVYRKDKSFILHRHEFEKIHPVYSKICSLKIYVSYFLCQSRIRILDYVLERKKERERERERERDQRYAR